MNASEEVTSLSSVSPRATQITGGWKPWEPWGALGSLGMDEDEDGLRALQLRLQDHLEPCALFTFLTSPEKHTDKFSLAFHLQWRLFAPQRGNGDMGGAGVMGLLKALVFQKDHVKLEQWYNNLTSDAKATVEQKAARELLAADDDDDEACFSALAPRYRMPDRETLMTKCRVIAHTPYWPNDFFVNFSFVSSADCCGGHGMDSTTHRSSNWGFDGLTLHAPEDDQAWYDSPLEAKGMFLARTASAKGYGDASFESGYWDQYDNDGPTLDASHQGDSLLGSGRQEESSQMVSFRALEGERGISGPSTITLSADEAQQRAREKHFAQIKSFGHGVSNISPELPHAPAAEQWLKPEAVRKAQERPWLREAKRHDLLRTEQPWQRGQERPQYPWTSQNSANGPQSPVDEEEGSAEIASPVKEDQAALRIFSDHIGTTLRSMKLSWFELGGSQASWGQIIRGSIDRNA